MNDELRERLRGVDPMPPEVPVEPVTATAARERLERIMNTPVLDQNTHQAGAGRTVRAPSWRRPPMLIGAAAAVAIAVIGAVAIVNSGGGDDDVVESAPLELSLGAPDVMASCLAFDVAILADMSPAFAATAVAVEGQNVTLDVDTWYAGGDADQVVLHAASGMQALIDGFEFEVGQQYLITAAEGTVNFCGYSGPATAELTAAFEQAFAG